MEEETHQHADGAEAERASAVLAAALMERVVADGGAGEIEGIDDAGVAGHSSDEELAPAAATSWSDAVGDGSHGDDGIAAALLMMQSQPHDATAADTDLALFLLASRAAAESAAPARRRRSASDSLALVAQGRLLRPADPFANDYGEADDDASDDDYDTADEVGDDEVDAADILRRSSSFDSMGEGDADGAPGDGDEPMAGVSRRVWAQQGAVAGRGKRRRRSVGADDDDDVDDTIGRTRQSKRRRHGGDPSEQPYARVYATTGRRSRSNSAASGTAGSVSGSRRGGEAGGESRSGRRSSPSPQPSPSGSLSGDEDAARATPRGTSRLHGPSTMSRMRQVLRGVARSHSEGGGDDSGGVDSDADDAGAGGEDDDGDYEEGDGDGDGGSDSGSGSDGADEGAGPPRRRQTRTRRSDIGVDLSLDAAPLGDGTAAADPAASPASTGGGAKSRRRSGTGGSSVSGRASPAVGGRRQRSLSTASIPRRLSINLAEVDLSHEGLVRPTDTALSPSAIAFLRGRRYMWSAMERAMQDAGGRAVVAAAAGGGDGGSGRGSSMLTEDERALYNVDGRIGIYTADERGYILERYVAKRAARCWTKQVRYDCRKNLADRRIRVKGRFVKAETAAAIALHEVDVAGAYVPTTKHEDKVERLLAQRAGSGRGTSPALAGSPVAPPAHGGALREASGSSIGSGFGAAPGFTVALQHVNGAAVATDARPAAAAAAPARPAATAAPARQRAGTDTDLLRSRLMATSPGLNYAMRMHLQMQMQLAALASAATSAASRGGAVRPTTAMQASPASLATSPVNRAGAVSTPVTLAASDAGGSGDASTVVLGSGASPTSSAGLAAV